MRLHTYFFFLIELDEELDLEELDLEEELLDELL